MIYLTHLSHTEPACE